MKGHITLGYMDLKWRMFMKKIGIYCVIALMLFLCMTGCNKSNDKHEEKSTTDSRQEITTKEAEYATGSYLSDEEALNEVSSNLHEEGFKIIYAGMRNDSEILGILKSDSENTILFKAYDVVKGKTIKKVKHDLDVDSLDDIRVAYFEDGVSFLKDEKTNCYFVFNHKMELEATVELSEDAMFDFVASDCSRIFYVERATGKVYAFNVEAMTKTLIYEFENNEQILAVVGVTDDMNHIVYKYINTDSTNTGYADIQIEEHTSTMNEDVDYTLAIANDDYVYYGYGKAKNQICFYSLDRPREIKMFSLDSETEIDSIQYIPNTDYFCTFVEGEKNGKYDTMCKLYDRQQGVLVEKTPIIENDKVISRSVSMSPNTELICIFEANESGIRVFVWNMRIPSGAIEENEPLEF